MRVDVTFEQTDMEIRPAFDTIIPIDISAASVQALLDGTISGAYISDKVTTLKLAAFASCTKLTYVSLPNCVQFDSFRTFWNCREITEIHLPNLTTIKDGNYAFNSMTSLQEIVLPSLTHFGSMNSSFAENSYIRKINLPRLGGATVGSNCFHNCYRLETLILGGDKLNFLGNTNAFGNAGRYVEEGFSIYVPDDLVDMYKTATNWTAYADRIKPMSELEA